jgi:hypothetical protein
VRARTHTHTHTQSHPQTHLYAKTILENLHTTESFKTGKEEKWNKQLYTTRLKENGLKTIQYLLVPVVCLHKRCVVKTRAYKLGFLIELKTIQ